ncbi:flavin-containing monooxygenase [Ruixingdingia sedimenti]|uniref:Trimethylamine monooxygenase n=1 Tax=Ruixingdingia sedimenti TaxID=3073604 RepID=A0ABU1FFY0_9RHOB|nr:NAD(P)/FAD-dependent oxidoreductase [Xinfangfangia sp. LG-4]MDR5655374.1 NAD(P)/FAD-dependent oxidoreductase [Xinfangfangia sp. LG-4]
MKIAIIGAGFAGLTTARHLRDFGHDVTVFEKVHDVGGVWSTTRLYPGVSTQNGKDTYCLSDFPMPKDYPEWPSGWQVQKYIESYADHFGLRPLIRLSTPVTHAAQGADGRWTVTYRPEGGEERSEVFDFLTICNGIFSAPAVPAFEGAEDFRAAGGMICHSSEFLNLDDARGRHVVVIGYGKSSCDVAVGLADAAGSMTVVARELIWKMPKKLGGVLNYKYLFLTRMGEGLFPYIQLKGVEKFLHGAGRPVRNSMLGSVQGLITRQLGLKKLGALPRGSFERIARSTVSLVTDGFFDLVRQGRIALKRDTAIARLEVADGRRFAVLTSGDRIPADVVICGTGWRQEVPFLDAEVQARLMDDRGNFRLYRHILPVGVRNLAFNGYNSSFFSPLSAEMGALWVAALIGGALRLPPERDQLAATDRRLRWMEERTEGKHARGTNIIPFSMHQIDELLADMDLSIGPMQRFMEWQLPVKPGSYARVAKDLHRRMEAPAGRPALA